MVSIVLPVYNGEKHLSEAIESVIGQTYSDWELIVVDDCSADKSNQIAQNYAAIDSRIKVIKNDINSKTPKALNNGFAIAKGDYFTWISDDNMYHPTAIAKMTNYLDVHPNIALVRTDFEILDEIMGKKTSCSPSPPTRENLLYGNNIYACFLYRREVHETLNGYDDAWFLIEDYDFWLRASRTFKFGAIPEVLYTFRKHKNAQTITRQNVLAEMTIQLIKREHENYVEDTDEIKLLECIITYCYIHNNQKLLKKYLNELKNLSPEEYKKQRFAFKAKCYIPLGVFEKMKYIKNRVLR